jgi:hypothetical protein
MLAQKDNAANGYIFRLRLKTYKSFPVNIVNRRSGANEGSQNVPEKLEWAIEQDVLRMSWA